jgi:hypothetical protein
MLLPEHEGNSGFGVVVDPFDASSEVSLHSSLLFLLDMIGLSRLLTIPFTTAALAEAAYGSLKPPPTGRLRRTYLHLSYSMTLARRLDTTPAQIRTGAFTHTALTVDE